MNPYLLDTKTISFRELTGNMQLGWLFPNPAHDNFPIHARAQLWRMTSYE